MRSAKDFLMRVPEVRPGQDWFRIENKKKADHTDVYIYDEIGFWGTSAADFVKELQTIDTSKITLHLNSPGGEVFDGVAIYNALKNHDAYVTVIVDALAASAASFIAQAGDELIMTRAATMMIHDASAMAYGNAKDLRDTANILDKLSNTVADIYQQRAGGTLDNWRAAMQEEVWYNAEEAVKAGLADKVDGDSVETPENKFDLLTFFNHTGRDSAPSPDELRRQVFNRVKETRMGTSADTEGVPPVVNEGEIPPVGTEEEAPPVGTEEEAPPVAVVTLPVSVMTAGTSFRMAGQVVTDPAAVQKYIDTLEGFQRETVNGYRKAFVSSLAAVPSKIAATQVDQLEVFALSLSNEQYESWVASWNAAPGLALLGSHAAGGRDGGEIVNAEKTATDKIDTAKEIVRQHKLSGMALESIKNTDSYKTVILHDPEFKL